MPKSKPSRTRGTTNGAAHILPASGSSSSLAEKPSTKNRSTTAWFPVAEATDNQASLPPTPPLEKGRVVGQGGKVRARAKPGHGLALVRRCVKTLRDKKAVKIEVIRVAETSSVTDYYIIATGTSDPHLRSLRIELEKAIDEVVPQGGVRIQNEPGSGWCVVDAFDVVIHIFSAEKRSYYNLEDLYSSGKKIKV